MVDFARSAATALRLIEASGRSVELFRVNRTPDDPALPWRGTSEHPEPVAGGLTIPVIMAFIPASGSGFGKLVKELGGKLTVAFEQVGLMASSSLPTGMTPADVEEVDSVRDGLDIWKVVTRGHLQPGDTSILFVLGLKR